MEDININEATSKDLLAYFQEKCDEEARQAHKKGKLVCWSAALAPPEFFEAMDIAVCYPETHSAGCGAKKCSMDLLEVADQKGYPPWHEGLGRGGGHRGTRKSDTIPHRRL